MKKETKMERISKDYEVRKAEIMNTGMAMFMKHGYEKTSVNSIIEAVGISKGTFYYYFKSKEELLDAIVEKNVRQIISAIESIVTAKDKSAIEKFNAFFILSMDLKIKHKDFLITMLEIWFDDSNLLIRSKMQKRNLKMATPLFVKIIEQGIAETVFCLPDSTKIAELILKIVSLASNDYFDLMIKHDLNVPLEEFVKLMNNYQLILERILGAPENAIKIYELNQLEEILAIGISQCETS
jgi:AcrR family transcriptional regulator